MAGGEAVLFLLLEDKVYQPCPQGLKRGRQYMYTDLYDVG